MATNICVKMVDGSGYEFNNVVPDIEDIEDNFNTSLETDKFVTLTFFKGDEYCSCTLRCDEIKSIYMTHNYMEE